MVHYEILFLTIPEITLDEASNLENQLRSVVRDHHGQSGSFERWGKYRLAYAVQKNDYGIYFLFRFDIQPTDIQRLIAAVRSMLHLKFGSIVMRYVTHRLKDEGMLYQRPESLEEVPGRTTDTLLREHKVSLHDEHESEDSTESLTEIEA